MRRCSAQENFLRNPPRLVACDSLCRVGEIVATNKLSVTYAQSWPSSRCSASSSVPP